MAYGLKTYQVKAPSWQQWRNGLNVMTKELLTASECDAKYGTNFSPKPKEHPLYRLLKSKSSESSSV